MVGRNVRAHQVTRRCGRLQGAHRSSAYGHHPTDTTGHRRRGRWGNAVAFLVHLMLGEVFGSHGLEGAGADVQRQVDDLDPARFDRGQQIHREMQACRGCCHRTGLLGVNGLIARFVCHRVQRVLSIWSLGVGANIGW